MTEGELNTLLTLSRLDIKEEEKDALMKDLEGILSYVGEISAIATEEKQLTPSEQRNIMREDVVTHEGGEYTEAFIKNAPKKEGNLISVKRIL